MKVKAPGYRILVKIKPIESKDTFEGSMIVKPDNSKSKQQREQEAVTQAYVMDVGPDAYSTYPNPWCKIGDCVQISRYSGTLISDVEEGFVYRMINDEDVQAVFPVE